MGHIAASLFTTVDGSAERPDQWHFPYFDEAMGKAVDRHTDRCEAYLMGRVLHDQWSQYWPGNDTDEFADFINPIPKYVLSTTLESSDWSGTTVLHDLDEVRALKERTEGTIGMSGSLATVRSLLEAGLLDELVLLVDPIVVSGERRWTDELGRAPLELVSSEALPTGVLHLVYRPARTG
ncbi:dihydrofolate reductase family protein [Blastococcus capsensis]|uniref:dihydrofolate reductase family protein n=1 Tax=Blastococcus capsensis TaxID=1564163 RepID=UPI002541DFE4|nr:dihydrofolate reductase family protein [Blastococcus capsensis]MDK3257450.1 dihydrofolate reductase family protein [Blastococcus capsensis]